MRQGLCRRNAENPDARPVRALRESGGFSFILQEAALFSFLASLHLPISPSLAPGFPWTGPSKGV